MADDYNKLAIKKEKEMKKIVAWLNAAVERIFGANKAPSVEFDIMKELAFEIDECEETEIENFKWEL